MSVLHAFSLLLICTPTFQGNPVQPPPLSRPATPPAHDLCGILVRDARTLEIIRSLDLDLAGCSTLELPVKRVEVLADAEDQARMRKAGLSFVVLERNLEESTARRLAKFSFPQTLTPAVGKGAMGGHYTLAQVTAILDTMAKTHPKICAAKVSIGKSIQGRPIWMVKISDNVQIDENEPEVLFDSLHHAREPLSITTTLVFMDWLLDNYGKDPEATFLVDNREMFFVPVLNPDGYEYNRSIRPNGGGMWRKNRRRNTGGSYGVDLNRNWPTGWSAPYGGNSRNPSSNVYRGTKALSEPETFALNAFIKTRKFTLGCSSHTYSDILLRPWGYKRANPVNAADYAKIEKAATAKNGIRAGAASLILYTAAGTALDHYHAAYKMFAFTPELGRASEGYFWPNPARQVAISSRHQAMFRAFAKAAGPVLGIRGVSILEGSPSNGNGKIEPGEQGRVVLTLANDGALASGTAVLNLKSLTPGITVTRGGTSIPSIPKFGSATNAATPLTFLVPGNFTAPTAHFEIGMTSGGQRETLRRSVLFVPATTLVSDDFESDRGFVRSTRDTATTGRFVRMPPQATSYLGKTYQPGSDHSATGTLCWVTDGRAGSSVGSYDVDNGYTELLSPVLDLSHVAAPTLSFWLWYSESVNPGDPFRVDASTDGGTSWKTIYSLNRGTFRWTRVSIPLDGLSPRGNLRFRFHAQDLSPSLVEALIDDLRIEGAAAPASMTLLGSGSRGTKVRFGLEGRVSGFAVVLISAATGALSLPGFDGKLLLSTSGLLVMPPLPFGTSKHLEFDLGIPNSPSLPGKTLYLQQLLIGGPVRPRFGNRAMLRFR